MQNDGQGNITAPSLSISGVKPANAANPTFTKGTALNGFASGRLPPTGTPLKINADSGIIVTGPLQLPMSSYILFDDIYEYTDGLSASITNKGQWPDGTDALCIIGSGSVGSRKIGLWDNVNVHGNLTTSGDLSSKAGKFTSDYRLKSNVRDIEEITTLNLRPVQFDMCEKHRIGLIAHELQEQIPCVVEGVKDGEQMQHVNYIDLIAVLIKDIQRLNQKIIDNDAKSESKISNLESRILNLECRMSNLEF